MEIKIEKGDSAEKIKARLRILMKHIKANPSYKQRPGCKNLLSKRIKRI